MLLGSAEISDTVINGSVSAGYTNSDRTVLYAHTSSGGLGGYRADAASLTISNVTARVAGMVANSCGCGIGTCSNIKCERFTIQLGSSDVKGSYMINTTRFDANNSDIVWAGSFSVSS